MENINGEWQEFLENNITNICDFMDKYERDINCKKKMLADACSSISQKVKVNPDRVNMYNNNNNLSGYTSIFIDFKRSEKEVYAYEPYFMRKPSEKSGEQIGFLYLAIWNRKNRKEQFEEIKNLFSKNYPMAEINKSNGWGNFLLLKKISFKDYDKESFVQESVKIVDELEKYCNNDSLK